jgi:hypothetical protein
MSFENSSIDYRDVFFWEYSRGPDHFLLEQPDKNGNLPLMHACAKLDVA